MFNLKEHINKVEDDKLVENLILFIIGHNTTFKCTRSLVIIQLLNAEDWVKKKNQLSDLLR